MKFDVYAETIGIMGTGSNLFRCGIVHSSGVIYLGTYGPQPAIVWKYDPKVGRLQEIGRPGEYQLDSMVEAPNGVVYIGTAYEAQVYRLDPATDEINCLGTPPIDSTPWIFTMIRTRDGEIYGVKGVGLFRLDWKADTFESIGLVPGEHRTLKITSRPIIRTLLEAPDGTLYGDTNRWMFRFDPKTGTIDKLFDAVEIDENVFGIFLPDGGDWLEDDLYFHLWSRFTDEDVANYWYVYHVAERCVEPLAIKGWRGRPIDHPSWIRRDGELRLLCCAWHGDLERTRFYEIDVRARKVAATWDYNSEEIGVRRLGGDSLHFFTNGRGRLLQADPHKHRFRVLAENPAPAQCRCLAASPGGLLGTDTYDCGFMFTRSVRTGETVSHGKVWSDDHRCNYGPAAFAGANCRYFLANHGEKPVNNRLWLTDTQTDTHRRIGEAAVQLVRLSDGSVWGTCGPNPPAAYEFDPGQCWTASWQARPGRAFRYTPGTKRVEFIEEIGEVGCLAEGANGEILAARGSEVLVYNPGTGRVVKTIALDGAVLAAARSPREADAYLLLEGGNLYAISLDGGSAASRKVAEGFGPCERAFFVLARSGRVVGVEADGGLSVLDPETKEISRTLGPAPLPAGPAVDPQEDAWYFADEQVMRYCLGPP